MRGKGIMAVRFDAAGEGASEPVGVWSTRRCYVRPLIGGLAGWMWGLSLPTSVSPTSLFWS